MEIKIPTDLKDMFDHIVKTRFKGDEEGAVIQAVVDFLQKERAQLVDDERFRLSLEKTLNLYNTRRERAASEFDDALSKVARRKNRAAEIFDSFVKDEDT